MGSLHPPRIQPINEGCSNVCPRVLRTAHTEAVGYFYKISASRWAIGANGGHVLMKITMTPGLWPSHEEKKTKRRITPSIVEEIMTLAD